MTRLFSALAALGLIIGGTGCGSDDSAAATTAAATTVVPTTVVSTTAAATTPAPSTEAPATTAAVAALDADQQAAANAFGTVFDSNVAFADKEAFIADAVSVQAAAGAYAAAGSAMGGISLRPTAVAIDGDTATITYDVLFGPAAAYEDLTETITRVDGAWVVSTETFCGFLTQARVPCP